MDSRPQRKRRQVDTTTDVRMYDPSLAPEFVRFFRLEEVSGTPDAYGKWSAAYGHLDDENLPSENYDRLVLAARAVELIVVMKTEPSGAFVLRRQIIGFIAKAFGDSIFFDDIDTDPRLINPAVDECLAAGASTVDVMKLVLTVFSGNMARIWGF